MYTLIALHCLISHSPTTLGMASEWVSRDGPNSQPRQERLLLLVFQNEKGHSIRKGSSISNQTHKNQNYLFFPTRIKTPCKKWLTLTDEVFQRHDDLWMISGCEWTLRSKLNLLWAFSHWLTHSLTHWLTVTGSPRQGCQSFPHGECQIAKIWMPDLTFRCQQPQSPNFSYFIAFLLTNFFEENLTRKFWNF